MAEHRPSQPQKTSRQSARSSRGKEKEGLGEVYVEDEGPNLGPWAASAEEEETERAQSRTGSVKRKNQLHCEFIESKPGEREAMSEEAVGGDEAEAAVSTTMAQFASSLSGLDLGVIHSPRPAASLSLKSKFALSSPALANDETPLFLLPQPRSKNKGSFAASTSSTSTTVRALDTTRGYKAPVSTPLPPSELIVAPQPLVDPTTEPPPDLAAAKLGILSRHQSKVDEALVHALREELELERRTMASMQLEHEHKVIETFGVTGSIRPLCSPSSSSHHQQGLELESTSKAVQGSVQLDTGHKLSPGYEPLTAVEISSVFAKMKAAPLQKRSAV